MSDVNLSIHVAFLQGSCSRVDSCAACGVRQWVGLPLDRNVNAQGPKPCRQYCAGPPRAESLKCRGRSHLVALVREQRLAPALWVALFLFLRRDNEAISPQRTHAAPSRRQRGAARARGARRRGTHLEHSLAGTRQTHRSVCIHAPGTGHAAADRARAAAWLPHLSAPHRQHACPQHALRAAEPARPPA